VHLLSKVLIAGLVLGLGCASVKLDAKDGQEVVDTVKTLEQCAQIARDTKLACEVSKEHNCGDVGYHAYEKCKKESGL
jgi:hypothetical protein